MIKFVIIDNIFEKLIVFWETDLCFNMSASFNSFKLLFKSSSESNPVNK